VSDRGVTRVLPGQPGTAPGPATAVHLGSRRGRRLVARPAGGTDRALRTGQLLQRGSASGLRARPTPSSAAGLPAGAREEPAGIRASLIRQDGFTHSDRRPGACAALPVCQLYPAGIAGTPDFTVRWPL
jgi:hypothetical protein